MKLKLLLIVGILFVANSFSQVEVVDKQTISTPNKKNMSGTYIANKVFDKILLNKEYNTLNDINVIKNNLSFSWVVLNKINKCQSCDEFYANITPQWHAEDFVPSQVIMRYTIRPSSNSIDLAYIFNIEEVTEKNNLILKLEEAHSGKQLVIGNHYDNNQINKINKTIKVVPGRTYYLDIIANYTTKAFNTSFSIDNIIIKETIKEGTIVLSNSANITYVD